MSQNNNINFEKNSGDHILSKFTQNVGLFDKIFGGDGEMMYNEEKDKVKLILKEVYGLDVYDMFVREVDEEKVTNTLRTIFRFNDLNLPDDDDISLLD